MPAGLHEAPRPGPQPLPSTLGWFPHPCPSVDAKRPRVCLPSDSVMECISPSPPLGSTVSPLSSILWPKIREQDTAQASGVPEVSLRRNQSSTHARQVAV